MADPNLDEGQNYMLWEGEKEMDAIAYLDKLVAENYKGGKK